MDRRVFLKTGSALAMAGFERRVFIIENKLMAWHLEAGEHGIRSTAFENRIAGARFELRQVAEAAAVFSAAHRMEIPRWEWSFTDGEGARWNKARNLAGGQRGRQYDGVCWFRHRFGLPPEGKGREVAFTLGGHDEQDWKEYRVSVNGQPIGHREVTTRWHSPGVYTVKPGDPAYASLQFGAGGSNLLTVRTRGYDFLFDGLAKDALDRYVFHPYLFDQFITIGQPFARVAEFELKAVEQKSAEHLTFELQHPAERISVTLDYQLAGFLRRKW
ncbi:MAG: hypothetical protein NTY38_22705, partial [Acidobacteria bacterium]|nr:hypothetical protein [Acidobacteriota bacterium]